MESLLDRSNPVHWLLVAVLLPSGLLTAWIGVRDGLVRRTVRTNSALLVGWQAVAAGLVYLAFGLAGVAGALLFLARGR